MCYIVGLLPLVTNESVNYYYDICILERESYFKVSEPYPKGQDTECDPSEGFRVGGREEVRHWRIPASGQTDIQTRRRQA
jgi:hypothetical protein